MSVPVPAPGLQLTRAQLLDWLHSVPETEVFAMLCGRHHAGLQAQLDALLADRNDPLWPGLLSAAQVACCPILCRLPSGAAVTPWLLDHLLGVTPLLGVFGISRAGYPEVRAHCRALCTMVLPDSSRIQVDWMDPEILLALLNGLEPGQHAALFGPFEQLVIVQPGGAQAWQLETSRRLALQPITVLGEAA